MERKSSGRDKFRKSRVVILICVKLVSILPRFIRVFLWDLTSRYSQVLFIGFRYIILRSMIKRCGDNIRIGTNVQIINWEQLCIGSNVSIHANCYIDAAGGVEIGNEVSIAHNSSILSTNHQWDDVSIPIKYNKVIFDKVVINDDVWIGCGCRILAGVVILQRSIIAAGAVVNKNIDSHVIVGGVPAKKIKDI